MTRLELEHIIRAAGDIAGVREFYILGSQSILGQFPELGDLLEDDPKDRLLLTVPSGASRRVLQRSMEADIMIEGDYERAESIENVIGELSNFHHTHGYYAQAVDETTCVLPSGWHARVIRICNANTNGVSGLCLDIHDLILSKLVANREKDMEFFRAAATLGILRKSSLTERVDTLPAPQETKERIKAILEAEL